MNSSDEHARGITQDQLISQTASHEDNMPVLILTFSKILEIVIHPNEMNFKLQWTLGTPRSICTTNETIFAQQHFTEKRY